MVDPLGGSRVSGDPGPEAYLGQLGSFARFAVSKPVLLTLLGLTLLTAPLYWAAQYQLSPAMAAFALLLAKGLEIMVYFRFIVGSAHGHEHADLGDFTSMYEDLWAPIVRYGLALLPIIAGLAWLGNELGFMTAGFLIVSIDPWILFDYTGPMVLVLGGLVLLPLLTLIAAISESGVAVLDPRVWVSSLAMVRSTYPVAAAVFYGVLALEILLWVPLMLRIQVEYSIPVVTTFVTSVLAYLPLALRARLLGGLAEPHIRSA